MLTAGSGVVTAMVTAHVWRGLRVALVLVAMPGAALQAAAAYGEWRKSRKSTAYAAGSGKCTVDTQDSRTVQIDDRNAQNHVFHAAPTNST